MEPVKHQTRFEDSPITVSVGWDEDMGRFFMCIAEGWGAASEPLYTNLYNPVQAHEMHGIEGLRAILIKIGIEVPESVFRRVEQCRYRLRGPQ